MREKSLRLIMGDQLNSKHSWFRRPDDRVTYLMAEVRQETDYVKHHIQKIAAFFAAMRAFAKKLKAGGHRVIYLTLDDPDNRQFIDENIRHLIRKHGFTAVGYMLPDEYRLDLQFRQFTENLAIPVHPVDSEHFLTDRGDVADFFSGKKTFRMESFYRHMRKRYNVLLESGKPVGGKWNFDPENRGKYDGRIPLPRPRTFRNDVRGIVSMVDRMQVASFGDIDPGRLIWPVDRSQALAVLDAFIREGLPHFGTYQDAMTESGWALFHSRLSFALNTKMLSPMEVIRRAVAAYQNRPDAVTIAQVEGFVRQILGWREYMRGMYWHLMPEFAAMNIFNHSEPLPGWYWTGKTRMNCLCHAISQSLHYAYAHHIQRLMVTGNFALLAGIAPEDVDAWYLGIYIDAVEWVEKPNTRGMSQFADGGIIATKPYVSSARYIHAMSDYCRSCSYRHALKYGEGACPFNSLYWAFLTRHRDLLAKNPRISVMYRTWDRMAPAEQTRIIEQAGAYLGNLNSL